MANNNTNEEMFNAMFKIYNKRVYSSAISIIRDHYLAQDVVQDTFLKAYYHFGKMMGVDNVWPWLKVVATNTAIDYYRRRIRNVELTDEIINCRANSCDVEQYIEQQSIRQQLSILNPELRNLLILKYEYGFTLEQLAQMQNMNINTIKSKIHRAKIKLDLSLRQVTNM